MSTDKKINMLQAILVVKNTVLHISFSIRDNANIVQ